MPGTSARAANTWLMTCTRQLTSQSASPALSCPLRESPALEKNTSTGPYLSSAAAISPLISSSWPTSAVTARPSISPATLASRSRDDLRSATTTPRAPPCAKARATASPIPLAAPVTTQSLFLTSIFRYSISNDGLLRQKHCFSIAATSVNSLSPCGCSDRGDGEQWERVGVRGYGLSIDLDPSPGSLRRCYASPVRSDLFHKGRGKAERGRFDRANLTPDTVPSPAPGGWRVLPSNRASASPVPRRARTRPGR